MVRWQHFLDKNSYQGGLGILVKKVLPPHHPVGGSVALAPAVNTPTMFMPRFLTYLVQEIQTLSRNNSSVAFVNGMVPKTFKK
jgi:hypothetical protein